LQVAKAVERVVDGVYRCWVHNSTIDGALPGSHPATGERGAFVRLPD
jgi:hypothetical protein